MQRRRFLCGVVSMPFARLAPIAAPSVRWIPKGTYRLSGRLVIPAGFHLRGG